MRTGEGVSTLHRYTVPCHTCEGKGYYDGDEDHEGYRPREECRRCTRGTMTIVLTEEAALDLLAQLEATLR